MIEARIIHRTQQLLIAFVMTIFVCKAQVQIFQIAPVDYKIYPEVNKDKPDLPSPFISKDGDDHVVAITHDNNYAIMAVTPGNDYDICKQLVVDTLDFPHLAKTGLHSEKRLDHIKSITGRTIEEITELGRPNGLSQAGFMAADETIISVIKGDNRVVRALGLKHPQLAKPLFHVLNMMDTDLSLNRWNMAEHSWENIKAFYYNDQKVYVEAEDTKGGQKSIFNDGIEGSFYIKLWRDLEPHELEYLKHHYGHLPDHEIDELVAKISTINTGEMEPQYIMRYGFYEGHTFWRTDPVAISFIFGLKSLVELDTIFEGRLDRVLSDHYTE